MMRWHLPAFLVMLAFGLMPACASTRQGVTDLSRDQQAYFSALKHTLTENRQLFEAGLRAQLEADRVRQWDLLMWERGLKKAEVLLQSDPTVSGDERLLSMKLAELDLADVARLAALEGIEESRQKALVALYDKVQKAVEALEKNNAVLLKYLESKDAVFALRSLDVDGVFRLVADLRAVEGEMARVDARAREQQKKVDERLQASIDRARDLLIRIYARP
jgi:hypothetical protein